MAKSDLRELLDQEVNFVADGAMSTSLYDKGFYINRSFEELCLTNPEAVGQVTQAFKRAGAQWLHTNTFSATRPKLTKYGLQSQLQDIIQAATRITAQVAGDDAWVVANMGPLGVVLEPLGPTSIDEATALFRETAQLFAETKAVDAFSVESFHDLKEMAAAVNAIRQVSTKPIFANLAIQENQRTSFGHSLEEFISLAHELDVDVIGISGEIGPSGLLRALEKIRPLTKKPLSLKPNAGMPQYVNDQYIYLCNPDYIAKFAKRFIQAGAQIVGGNCGVSDEHIRAIANTVRMLAPQNKSAAVIVKASPGAVKAGHHSVPREQRSRLGSYFAEQKRVFSVELNPPKGVNCEKFFKHCEELQEGGVAFVNIPDGARAVARMSSLQLSSYVRSHFQLEPIPHLTCRDRNLIGLQSDLLGCYVNGVRNLLLVTGDPPKLGDCPDASAVYDVDAIGLTHVVHRMNRGLDLGGSDFGDPTQFLVGVALNPTAHNQDLEIQRFRYKLEAGADYAITQPIYDLDAYQRFFDKLGPISIPVLMGIWPLVSLRNAEFLKNEVPGVMVPDWVLAEMEKACGSKQESLERGVEIAVRTVEKAQKWVAGFQVSAPFNNVATALKVIHAL